MSEKAKEVVEAADAVTWPGVADKALEGLQAGLGEIGKVVQSIAKELSESAPHVWHGLVEYHRWIAIGELIANTLWVIAAITLMVIGKKNYSSSKKEGEERKYKDYRGSNWPEDVQFKFGVSIAMMVISSIVLVVILVELPYLIGDIVVPERRAAIEIIQIISSGGKELPQR